MSSKTSIKDPQQLESPLSDLQPNVRLRGHRPGGMKPQWVVSGLVLAGLVGAVAWHHWSQAHGTAIRQVYTPSGYGGYRAVSSMPTKTATAAPMAHSRRLVSKPLAMAQTDYAKGQYTLAESAAQQVVRQASNHPDLMHRRQEVGARQVLAYSAARRHDLALARERFAALQQAAAALPDKGAQKTLIGEDPQPTLEADAAYQHAVCTAALGDTKTAEAEYCAVMRNYPDSPLLTAALKRIANLHKGDVPPADLAVWRQAMTVAENHARAKLRDQSLCGPECLAELERRNGKAIPVSTLASAMHTSDQGTSLADLARVAKSKGFAPQGLALTWLGLQKQPLPVIALVAPGHYLLVDKVTPLQVTVWDPDAQGAGDGAERVLSQKEWRGLWSGFALAMKDLPQGKGV